MNYHEKTTWVSLASALLIFGVYFIKAASVVSDPGIPDSSLIWLFGLAVLLSIVIQVTTQIFFALRNRKEVEAGMDERDKSIDMLTRHRAYYVLVFGIWIAVGTQLIDSRPSVLINTLMASFVISEVVAYISKLVIYRRGY